MLAQMQNETSTVPKHKEKLWDSNVAVSPDVRASGLFVIARRCLAIKTVRYAYGIKELKRST